MFAQYLLILGAVAPIFAIIAAGYFMRRVHWLTAEADRSLLQVTVNFLYPCLIFDNVLGNPALSDLRNLLLAPVVGFATVVLGFGLALLTARLLRLGSRAQKGTFAFTTGIYNYAYMGLPLVFTLYDQRTAGVLFIHNLGVEIALWTVGIMILSGSATGGWKRVLNLPVLSLIIALALHFLHGREWIPGFLLSTVRMVGATAIPIALMLTGATFADLLGRNGERMDWRALIPGNLLRLGLLPLLFLLLAWLLPCPVELKRVIVIQAAMPAAVLPLVLTRHYGGDPAVALTVVFSTTLLGLLTIPWWIHLGRSLIGV